MTFLLFFLLISLGHSTITITPVSPNSATSSIFYYAASGAASPLGFVGTGFRAFDLSQGLVAGTTSTSDMILLDIKSSTDFTVRANQALVLKFYANINGTGEAMPFPIAAAGVTTGTPALCLPAGSNASCVNPLPTALADGKFWMANYPEGQTLRVGIYPKDICYYVDWVKGGGTSLATKYAQGCKTNLLVIDPATTTASIEFTADVYLADTAAALVNASTVYTAATGGSEDVGTATLNFQQTAPTYSCSSMASVYFPGDGTILLNGSLFSASKATGGAPVSSVFVVGKKTSAPLTAEATYTSNDIVNTGTLGIESSVGGFTNTTDGTDNIYNLAFSVQDKSGFVADFVAGCSVNNVQTSEIQTFLRTNRCFIASSAFRDHSAIPVLILREFRDQILLKTRFGKLFVNWYYVNSPQAAEWLWVHSEYRYVVIFALSPLILLAMFFIHPEALIVIVLGSLVIWFNRNYRMRKKLT